MKKIKILTVNIILMVTIAAPLYAQETEVSVKGMFEQQFDYASRILQLAEAAPADLYSWRPAEGVRSFGEVYTHIIQANYMILGTLGISGTVDVQGIGALTEKEDIIAAFEESVKFIKSSVQNLPDEKLAENVELFGRTINGEWVLVFILNHTGEHAGQIISYARMNGITPPWSGE